LAKEGKDALLVSTEEAVSASGKVGSQNGKGKRDRDEEVPMHHCQKEDCKWE
jgi:hypothetical protein